MKTIKLAPLLAFVASAAAAACAHSSPEATPSRNEVTCRPIEGEALRTLLRDALVTPVQNPGVTVGSSRAELFRANGYHRLALSRSSVEGTFVIEGDLVCVEAGNSDRLCRRVIEEGNGTYSFVDAENGASTLMNITYPPK